MFHYSYEEVIQTVVPRQKVQTAIDGVSKGIGWHRIVRKFKWPWQRPNLSKLGIDPVTRRQGIVYLCPGIYRESITVSDESVFVYPGDNVAIIG